jgi:hypothetical protein
VKRFLKFMAMAAVIITTCLVGSDGNAQVPPSYNSTIVAPGANPRTVTLWQRHQIETSTFGQTWIGPYITDSRTSSGKRDTIIFVPSQFDRTKPTDVIIWLHGHHGFNKFNVRILRHLSARYARGDNVIVIAVEQPWTHNGSTPTSRNKTGPFRQDGEFSTWMDTIVFPALRFFRVDPTTIASSRITLYGHSAGGSGILSMSRSDALNIATPGTIVFSDSTYGSWFREFYDNFYRDHPLTNVVVLVRRGGPTHDSMSYFFRDRPAARDLATLRYLVLDRSTWTHKRIGDNCLLYPGTPFPP